MFQIGNFLGTTGKNKDKVSFGGYTLGQGHKDIAIVKASPLLAHSPKLKIQRKETTMRDIRNIMKNWIKIIKYIYLK